MRDASIRFDEEMSTIRGEAGARLQQLLQDKEKDFQAILTNGKTMMQSRVDSMGGSITK